MLSAVMLLKKQIWSHAAPRVYGATRGRLPVMELQSRFAVFFDKAVYHLTRASPTYLHVEAEVDDVTVGHQVVLALDAEHPRIATGLHVASWLMKSPNDTTSARMKPRWISEWMAPAASRAVFSARNGPGPHFIAARGQKAYEPQLRERRLGYHLACWTRKT